MAVAAMLLFIACINYVNLSTARTTSRLKVTGVHKLLGASRRQILGQSLIESFITFSIAGLVATLCYQLALPTLQHFIGHPLAFRFSAGWPYLASALSVFLLICLLSGLYPAWLVSGFRATGSINQVLKGRGSKRNWLRETLVAPQFALSIGIMVALLVVQHQVDFLKTKDVGFDTEGLISLNHVSWDNKAGALKAELAKHPDKLLDMEPVKETLERQYQAEEKLQKLFGGFSLLTMLLAALGVFGLVVHATSLRVKEIGIRKVLGASVSGIVGLLSKDFVKLVLVAIAIASPIAWWAMNSWLQDFAYRIAIQWWVFAVAGLTAVIIALLTVSWQAIRAAVANPVDSLRDE